MDLHHLLNHFQKLYICFRKPLTRLVVLFSLEQNQYLRLTHAQSNKRYCQLRIRWKTHFIQGQTLTLSAYPYGTTLISHTHAF